MSESDANTARAVPVSINMQAHSQAFPGAFSDDRFLATGPHIYITGMQALARLPIDRMRTDTANGLHTRAYVSGYEGSPLAGFDLEIARQANLMRDYGVLHEPGLNEELAATAVMGTQLAAGLGKLTCDGVVAYWYGKAPGLDRATDAIRHANMVGTSARGGVLALVGDDPEAKSSSLPSKSEHAVADLRLVTLAPADHAEALRFGAHGVEVSRASGMWASMLLPASVADSSGTLSVQAVFDPPRLDDLPGELSPYSHRPSAHLLGQPLLDLEESLLQKREPVALEYIRRSGVNQILRQMPNERVGFVASGPTYLSLSRALERLDLKSTHAGQEGVRLLKLGAIYPIDDGIVRDFATGLEHIFVVEDKRSFFEESIKSILYSTDMRPEVLGRASGSTRIFHSAAALSTDLIAKSIRPHLTRMGFETVPADNGASLPALSLTPTRTPNFCSGCPHNTSTAASGLSPVGAGIGCHSILLLAPEKGAGEIVGLTQMGGEGAQWLGMKPFVSDEHFIQNMGDGTWAHSGSLAIRAAVASGANVTYKILFNGAVAMTGGQSAVGGNSLKDLVSSLMAEGVSKVVVTTDNTKRTKRTLGRGITVRGREHLATVEDECRSVPGVSVIVHDQECAIEKRRRRRSGADPAPRELIVINERICEGCGDCGRKSRCLAVQPVATKWGLKTRISQSNCNDDASCLQGTCPAFTLVRPEGDIRREESDAGDVRTPEFQFSPDGFCLRLLGVGGTGIVTVSQILANAASIDGLKVRALDQTGLARKGGAVVSDLHFTRETTDRPPSAAAGEVHVYAGCDPLVALDERFLNAADPKSTVAVLSTSVIPTGEMVLEHKLTELDTVEFKHETRSRFARTSILDTVALAKEWLRDEQYSNMIMVGVCYQLGYLPLSLDSILTAIDRHGASVEKNRLAFHVGREAMADVDGVRQPLEPVQQSIDELLAELANDLRDYQNEAYASDFRSHVATVRAWDYDGVDGDEFVRVFARALHKLMAYKDEYEVARLTLDSSWRDHIRHNFGASSKSWSLLQPPFLRMLGLNKKIRFAPWSMPALRALRLMRRVRGSIFDFFGWTKLRRTERGLIPEYIEAINQIGPNLNMSNYDGAISIADLPQIIRGYEEVKWDAIHRYHEELSAGLNAIHLLSKSSVR